MSEPSGFWSNLTRSSSKAQLYERETWFREGWRDACDLLGRDLTGFLDCAALMIIKPDGLVSGKAALIVDFVKAQGFDLVAVETPTLTRHQWREMWRYQMTMATLDRLAVNDLVLCDRVVLLALRHRQPRDVPATVHLSVLKGPSDVKRQRPGCLRSIIRQPNRLLSMFHVADEPADVLRELAILLDAPSRRAILGAYALGRPLPAGHRRRLAAALRRSSATPREFVATEALARVSSAIKLVTGDSPRLAATTHRQLLSDLDRMQHGLNIDWVVFMRALEAASIDTDRWDLAALGSAFITYDDPGATRQIEAVDPASWRAT